MRSIILDMDVGVDDALAIIYLSAVGEVQIEALGSVHGNVDAINAAENGLRVLELVGLTDVPIAIGASRPMVRPASFAPDVHGADGLGDTDLPRAKRRPESISAPEQIIRLARTRPGELDILATGPLTNLGMALLLEPELPQLVRSVTLMGGAASGVGNVTASAEANIWHDPEAASLVFGASWPITMVGLDVTMRTILDESAIAAIGDGSTPYAEFAAAILAHYLDFYESITGRRACPLHDPSAAAVLADPSLVTEWLDAEVAIGLTDEARGMTIVDRRARWPQQPNAGHTRIVLGLDADRFVPDLVRILTR